MRTKMVRNRLFQLVPVAIVVISGLTAYSSEPDGVMETIRNAKTAVDTEKHLQMALPVPEKTVWVKSGYQKERFKTETRKEKIERYTCSRCHNNKSVNVTGAAKMAHGDIVLDHGGDRRPLSCLTCHKKDERDYLENEKGQRVDMDHSYQVCGQCHFRQSKDWAGGAHGKRVAFWTGTRVVKNCTSCHDAHSPRFKKRWPVTYSAPLSDSLPPNNFLPEK